MADGLVAFEHELGNSMAMPQLPWAETFDLNLTNGAQLITVKQMIPDVDGDASGLLYSLFYRNSRSTGAPELRTTPIPVRSGRLCRFPDHGTRHSSQARSGVAAGSELYARSAFDRRRAAG